MARPPQLSPENQFPSEALRESVQVQPEAALSLGGSSVLSNALILQLATVADSIPAWGVNVKYRDIELRRFWNTEPFLAGAVRSNGYRNAGYDWEIQGPNAVVKAATDMLLSAIAGDMIGWVPFILKQTQDGCTQDNGWFMELIRDPGMDAASKFKGPMAPVVGIAHMDAGQCTRTGDAEYPVVYEDREGKKHKMAWYEVIPFSDFPSPKESMNGTGYCAVSTALRLAQIMKSIEVFKDEKISGQNVKDINLVSGVSRIDIADAVARTQEQANNKGYTRFIEHVVLASLDPEKPVSVATVSLADFPDGFDFATEMQWYIAGLALSFGADYQDFAPLPGGGIGSSEQSIMLNKKSSGKGPRTYMRSITEAFKNYGVIPANAVMVYNDKNEQEELEKQTVRTKAMEEAAIAANSRIFPRQAIANDLVRRGIFTKDILTDVPEDFWQETDPNTSKQPVGDRGGNTLQEDAKRVDRSQGEQNAGDKLRR